MVHYSSESIFDEQAAQATEIGEWLEDHHASVQSDNGEEYHVFAVTGSPSFGGLGQPRPKYKVDIHIPIGPITLIIVGFIDLRTFVIDADVYVKFPLLRPIKIGHIHGDLRKGVILSFKGPNVSGTIELVLRGRWLHVIFDVTIFQKHYVADLRVLLLPVIPGLEGAEEKEGNEVANSTAVAAAA